MPGVRPVGVVARFIAGGLWFPGPAGVAPAFVEPPAPGAQVEGQRRQLGGARVRSMPCRCRARMRSAISAAPRPGCRSRYMARHIEGLALEVPAAHAGSIGQTARERMDRLDVVRGRDTSSGSADVVLPRLRQVLSG